MYKNSEGLVNLLVGHGQGQGKGLQKDLLFYIAETMQEKYLTTLADNWTNEQVRNIREDIIKKACADAGFDFCLLDLNLSLRDDNCQ